MPERELVRRAGSIRTTAGLLEAADVVLHDDHTPLVDIKLAIPVVDNKPANTPTIP